MRSRQQGLEAASLLAPPAPVRADGTLAYFFTPEGLTSLAEAAGFEVEEARYATTALRNRKSGAPEMKRVFVHAVLRKPAEG